MKTIAVTGGAGFLGSRLCEVLLEQGHRIICVDNLLSGRLANIAHLRSHPYFDFLRHDIIDPVRIHGELDEIFNLACPASPKIYQSDPVNTLKTCVLGAINMLELAHDKNARILQASTSEVYGDPDFSPQPETYHGNVNSYGPRSCYDEGKRAAETLFHDFHQKRGVPTRIARIFNTYGPRMRADDGRVVSNFVVQALQGEPLTVYGDGKQTRSFCYVDDLVDGLLRLMAADNEAATQPVNLGNPGEFTMLELAELVLEKTGAKTGLTFQNLPMDDPHQRRPDISRATELLGWRPKVPLSEGLDLTIAHFREALARCDLPLTGAFE